MIPSRSCFRKDIETLLQLGSLLDTLVQEKVMNNLENAHFVDFRKGKTNLAELVKKQRVELDLQIELHFFFEELVPFLYQASHNQRSNICVIVLQELFNYRYVDCLHVFYLFHFFSKL